jgi:hypothetical protein
VAIGRAERMAERRPRIVAIFGEAAADTVIGVLTLTELAWHDCYGEVTPSESVIDDILLCSGGDLATLIRASKLAVEDSRDLMVWAGELRSQRR